MEKELLEVNTRLRGNKNQFMAQKNTIEEKILQCSGDRI